MASSVSYITRDTQNIRAANEVDSCEDDLSSLSDFNDDDDNSLDEYFEDDLIPDDPDTSVISTIPDTTDEIVVIPGRSEGNYTEADYNWRTGYTVNWKSYGNSNNCNNVSEPNSSLNNLFNSTESALSRSNSTKKKLSVDLEPEPKSNGSSFFRTIGSWFRGNNKGSKSETPTPNNNQKKDPAIESPINISTPQVSQKTEVGTSFSRTESSLRNSQRKKIHFSLSENDENDSEEEVNNLEESSSTESLSPNLNLSTTNGSPTSKPDFPKLEVTYELYTADNQQYICWQRQFRRCPGVLLTRKSIDASLIADALILPGNSFGFLDGEPEIQYVKLFGWEIQRRIRQTICQCHDGELLIGEAIILPLNKTESGSNYEAERSESELGFGENFKQALRTISVEIENDSDEHEYCKTVKNIIYVPVMRVPVHVPDTVNAYLAFRAAIRAVKTHNQNCDEAKKISSVACPPLCGDIGRMPPSRIALQMKTAYDAFVLNKRHDVRTPVDMGSLATNHVELTTAKNGNWC